MIGKLIISFGLVTVSMSAKCSREVWNTMLEATSAVNVTDPAGDLLMFNSAESALEIMFSEVGVALMANPKGFECYTCFEDKFTLLYEVYSGASACKSELSDRCVEYLRDHRAAFEYCESFFVEPLERCSNKESDEIANLILTDQGVADAKLAKIEAAYMTQLHAAVNAKKPMATDLPCWTCYEAAALAGYWVSNGIKEECNAAGLPQGCIALVDVATALSKCVKEWVLPPQKPCDSGFQSQLQSAITGPDTDAIFKHGYSKQLSLAYVLGEVRRSLVTGPPTYSMYPSPPGPEAYACYSCHEDYFSAAFEALTGTKAFCETPNVTGCINKTMLTATRSACLTASKTDQVLYKCSTASHAELAQAVMENSVSADLLKSGGDPTKTVVAFFASAAFIKAHSAALSGVCVRCLADFMAQVLRVDRISECRKPSPRPLSCGETLTNYADVYAEYQGCLAATLAANSVTPASLSAGLILVAFVNLFL